MQDSATRKDQRSLAMIVIGFIMAMSMHRPEKILFEPMRVSVIGNHLTMVLKGFKNCRDMGGRRCCGPQRKGQA